MAKGNHGNCPHCGADLNGGSIWQHFYNEFTTKGDWQGAAGRGYTEQRRILSHEEAERRADEVASHYGATRTQGQWGREIGIYDREKDRTVEWQCPYCNGRWPRA